MPTRMTVNGETRDISAPDHATLLEVLRGELGLTGAKPACDVGDCGACAVLVDGAPTLACITLAGQLNGAVVVTVEGVAQGQTLHRVQEAFHRAGAAQCGYCTPGFIIAAVGLLEDNPSPTEAEVRQALSGNLCRCTGYTAIIAAVMEAAGARESGGPVKVPAPLPESGG